jgi:hypothetical protein
MKVALGFSTHSGWAALVVMGRRDSEILIVDRRRIELVEEEWAKAPYHASENLRLDEARDLVGRGIEAAHRIAAQQMKAIVDRERARANEVFGCGVLVGKPMPDWSVEEVLAVHFRMHKAEGVLFREALLRGSEACGLKTHAVEETALRQHQEKETKLLARLGKTLGPPWGKDQKDAAVAALMALP